MPKSVLAELKTVIEQKEKELKICERMNISDRLIQNHQHNAYLSKRKAYAALEYQREQIRKKNKLKEIKKEIKLKEQQEKKQLAEHLEQEKRKEAERKAQFKAQLLIELQDAIASGAQEKILRKQNKALEYERNLSIQSK